MSNETSHYIGVGIGGGTGILLTSISIFSARTRCSMVLMIPSILTKRGRGFIFTFITGLLVDGPIDTIGRNLQEVIRSFTCMYDQAKSLGDNFLKQFDVTFKVFAELMQTVSTMVTQFKHTIEEQAENATKQARDKLKAAKEDIDQKVKDLKSKLDRLRPIIDSPGNICDEGVSAVAGVGETIVDAGKTVVNFLGRRRKRGACGLDGIKLPKVDIPIKDLSLDMLKFNPDINILDMDFGDIPGINGPSIKKIREQMKAILKGAIQFGKHVAKWISKIFYVSILLIILDAIKFMKSYYSDDAFDNMFIDNNIQKLWKEENLEQLTPMRNWELNERYQISTSCKLAKEEVKTIFLETIPTIIFTMIALGIVLADFSFSSVLVAFRENARFGFTFEGMENGITLNSLKELNSGSITKLTIQPFNLTTDPCLPVPTTTDSTNLGIIFVLLALCGLTCFLNAYMSRLRSRICNTFFPERAAERGRYLYKKIQAGRRTRHHQLQLILKRSYNIRTRSKEFQGLLSNVTDILTFRVSIGD